MTYAHRYVGLQDTISAINADADLVKYREKHGVGQALIVPTFVAWGSSDSGDFTMAASEGMLPSGNDLISKPILQSGALASLHI
jgi:hypothetical protein